MIKELVKEVVKSKLNKNRLPWNIILFVTSKCNSKCKHCFYWQNVDNSDKKDLSLEEIEKISPNLGDVYWLYLSGGEPFLRDDLTEICQIFVKNNKTKNIAIPTNCILTDRIIEETRRILETIPRINLTIQLSLDGREEIHDYIRGIHGLFQKVYEVEKRLSELKKEFPNLSTLICSVLNKVNIGEMVPLMEFVKEKMNVDFHSIELMRGVPRDISFELPDIKQIEEFFIAYKKNREFYLDKDYRYYKQYYGKSKNRKMYEFITKKINNWLDNIQINTLKEKKKMITCTAAGRIFGVIGETGEVYLCELLPSIGNLREVEYDFKKLWFNDKAKEQRKMIKKQCYCTHCLFLTKSAIMQPGTILKSLLSTK